MGGAMCSASQEPLLHAPRSIHFAPAHVTCNFGCICQNSTKHDPSCESANRLESRSCIRLFCGLPQLSTTKTPRSKVNQNVILNRILEWQACIPFACKARVSNECSQSQRLIQAIKKTNNTSIERHHMTSSVPHKGIVISFISFFRGISLTPIKLESKCLQTPLSYKDLVRRPASYNIGVWSGLLNI